MRHLLIAALILLTVKAHGSTSDSLSLLREFAIHKSFNELSFEWQTFVVQHAAFLRSESSINQRLKPSDSIAVVGNYAVLATVEYFEGNSDRSFELLTQARDISARNKFVNTWKSLNRKLAEVSFERGQYDLALKRLTELLRLLEDEEDSTGLADAYIKISRLYTSLQDTTGAMAFADSAILLLKKRQTSPEMGAALLEKARILSIFHNNRGVEIYLDRAKSICFNQCTSFTSQLQTLLSANLAGHGGRIDEARQAYQKLANLTPYIQPSYFQVEAMLRLASFERKTRRSSVDMTMLYQARTLAGRMHYNELLLEIYDEFIQVFTRDRNYDSLAAYQSLYIAQRDLIFGEEKLIRIAEVRAEFETRKEVNLIEEQKELMALQEKALEQKMYINIAVGSVVVMLIGILVVLYRINKKRKHFNRNLDLMVQERTRELEAKHMELVTRSRELELQIEAMYRRIQAPVSTMEGIYQIAQKDETMEVTEEQLAELKSIIEELRGQMAALKEFTLPFRMDPKDGTAAPFVQNNDPEPESKL